MAGARPVGDIVDSDNDAGDIVGEVRGMSVFLNGVMNGIDQLLWGEVAV